MKYFCAFIVALCFACSMHAQVSPLGSKDKFLLGLSFSPDITYRDLEATERTQFLADMRNKYGKQRLGYTAGLNSIIRLNRIFFVEAGVMFARKGELMRDAQVDVVDASGAGDKAFLESDVRFDYLEIPLKLNLAVGQKRIRFFLSGGISSNIFLQSDVESTIIYKDGKLVAQSGPYGSEKLTNFAWLAGAGVDYHLSDALVLRVEPIYRKSFTSIVRSDLKIYPYSAGLNAGLYVSF